jgi:hypothetical protein
MPSFVDATEAAPSPAPMTTKAIVVAAPVASRTQPAAIAANPPGIARGIRGERSEPAIYDVFSALAAERQPPKAALRKLSTVYAGAVENGVLAAGPQAVAKGSVDDWDWVWAGRDPDRPLWPIAVAAADLLRSDRLGRLKMCGNCRWLFLDRSRNGSRRWCSMDECGVHTKMRRYRARKAA